MERHWRLARYAVYVGAYNLCTWHAVARQWRWCWSTACWCWCCYAYRCRAAAWLARGLAAGSAASAAPCAREALRAPPAATARHVVCGSGSAWQCVAVAVHAVAVAVHAVAVAVAASRRSTQHTQHTQHAAHPAAAALAAALAGWRCYPLCAVRRCGPVGSATGMGLWLWLCCCTALPPHAWNPVLLFY
jgi:hypothetical protein